MHKLGRKVANESTVIIYPKTPEKSKQYEDMTVRSFNLNYMEAKKAINLIRTLLQVRKIYVNEESNSIVVRDTSDVVEVVEKILDAHDVPDAEVILDVEVLEIGETDGKTVGLLLSPYNVQMGAFNSSGKLMAPNLQSASTTSTGTTTTTTTADVTNLIKAFVLKGYGGFVTVPNAQFDFAKTLGKAEVLSNPKIRVKNREKAKFNVGTRVPITTSNTTNSTISVNVQYVDVGVKVNAEPTIQPNNEIVIKLGLEVSQQVGAARDLGNGTSVVTIGTRNLDTVLSLKDGETSVIGGLIERNSANDKKGIVYLSDIPLLGELLTNTNASNSKTELMLAITPRLVRGVTVPQGNLASFVSGKEDDPALTRSLASFDQEPLFETEQKPAAKRPMPQQPAPQPATQQPVPQQPAVSPSSQPQSALPAAGISPQSAPQPFVPQTTPPQAATPQPVPPPPGLAPQQVMPPVAAKPAVSPPVTAAVPAVSGVAQPGAPVPVPAGVPQPVAAQGIPVPAQRGFLQIGSLASASIGQVFTLDVKATSISDLSGAPFVLTYDPIFVEFISASEGDFLRKDGVATVFGSAVSAATGTVSINLARAPGKAGASGAGTLASLTFRAKQKGPASFGFRNVSFTSSDNRPLSVLPFSAAVEIK
jgi:general secretion pathway protein D